MCKCKCCRPNNFALVLLAFFGSVGMTLLVIGCATHDNWWPFFVTIFYVLAPVPMLLSRRYSSSGMGPSNACQELAIFITMGIDFRFWSADSSPQGACWRICRWSYFLISDAIRSGRKYRCVLDHRWILHNFWQWRCWVCNVVKKENENELIHEEKNLLYTI